MKETVNQFFHRMAERGAKITDKRADLHHRGKRSDAWYAELVVELIELKNEFYNNNKKPK